MTYKERQKAICKECTDYNTSKCPYVIRSLRCPNLSNQMEGWELGYKDAVKKSWEWLHNRYNENGYLDLDDVDELKKFMENDKESP